MESSSSKNQSSKYAIRTVKYQNSLMVNVCDLDLIDKQINHGEITINMKKNYLKDLNGTMWNYYFRFVKLLKKIW